MRIKSYSEINLAVHRQRRETQYRLWLLARALDVPGNGMVTEQTLWSALKREGLYQKRQMQNTLRAGDGLFWHRGRGRIRLAGLLAVASALGVELGRRPVYIDSGGTLAEFRALLVESWVVGKPKTVSIATVARLIDRSKGSAGAYLKACHKHANYMLSDRPPGDVVIPELANRGFFRKLIDGQWRLVKQMPNTYWSDLEQAPYGCVKRRRSKSSFFCACGATRRLYFHNQKGLQKAIGNLAEGETVYSRRDDYGLWDGWTKQLGEVACW